MVRAGGHAIEGDSYPTWTLCTGWRCNGYLWLNDATSKDRAQDYTVMHDASAQMPRDVRKVVAESVASAVCSRFGLDLSLRSVDYVAGWLDDPEAFRVGMAAIHDGAASLIDAIEAATTDAGELELIAVA